MDQPFPSSPHRPPRYTIKFTRQGSHITEAFYATYAAFHYINAVVGDKKTKWLNDHTLVATGDNDISVTIECEPNLDQIMEFKPSPKEREWLLPEPFLSRAHFLSTGETRTLIPKKQQRGILADDDRGVSSRGKKDRERAAPTKREHQAGHVTIADVAAEAALLPRDARAILRKYSTKPEGGWSWPQTKAKEIVALLKKHKK